MTTAQTAIVVAIVGFLAAAVGGLIQAISARTFEKYKFEQQAKWELYSQYFFALGELTFSELDSERHVNALSLMAQLRGRIGLIASAAVIESVGEVFKYPSLLETDAQEAMARTLNAMRADVGKADRDLAPKIFIQLMFGSRESDW